MNVEFVPIPESGHWVPEENPDDLLREVTKFLRKALR